MMAGSLADYLKILNLDPNGVFTPAEINRAHKAIIVRNGAGLAGRGSDKESAETLIENIKLANVARDALIKRLSDDSDSGADMSDNNKGHPPPHARRRSADPYEHFNGVFRDFIPREETREARYQRQRYEILASGGVCEELIAEMSAYELMRSSQVTGDILGERYPDAYRKKVFPYCLHERANHRRVPGNSNYYPLYDDKLIRFLTEDPTLAFITLATLDDNSLSLEVFSKIDEIFRRTLSAPDPLEIMTKRPYSKRNEPKTLIPATAGASRPSRVVRQLFAHLGLSRHTR